MIDNVLQSFIAAHISATMAVERAYAEELSIPLRMQRDMRPLFDARDRAARELADYICEDELRVAKEPIYREIVAKRKADLPLVPVLPPPSERERLMHAASVRAQMGSGS